MLSFDNPRGRKSNGDDCDTFGRCDHVFRFSLDRGDRCEQIFHRFEHVGVHQCMDVKCRMTAGFLCAIMRLLREKINFLFCTWFLASKNTKFCTDLGRCALWICRPMGGAAQTALFRAIGILEASDIPFPCAFCT